MTSRDKLWIDFRDDSAFRESLINGNPDPIGGIRISTGDEYLVGGKNEYLPTWVTDFVIRLVDSGIDVLDGEQRTIVNHNGPSYLVIKPSDEEEVEVSHRLIWEAVEDPDEYPELIETTITTSDTFVSAVDQVGQRLLAYILEHNPQLTDSETVSDLQKVLELLEGRKQSANIEETEE
ncbi:hypothetical protein [Natrinema sp. SYSU A 869]|uniref:hypothetical protein n=1 Tax=Natrinema sp. SYSU A 869 TaxID=2871694 RepID=UPI001CA3A5AE|nr:hypothetical protein [Natrinema sp. SYSU A 869]